MSLKLKTPVFVVSGKNPITARSGYAAYSYNLTKITHQLGFRTQVFCFGQKEEKINSPIGQVNSFTSLIFDLPILKDVEMAALPILSLQLFLKMRKELDTDTKTIVWGVGPWSLSGALLKLFYPKKVIFYSDYFTTIKHEFAGTIEAINTPDYSFFVKTKHNTVNSIVVPTYSVLERFIMKQSDKVITHYKSTEEILRKQFGTSQKKFVRLPYSVEIFKRPTKLKEKFPLPPKPRIILVARHDGRKGINYLLHAFKIMEERNLNFSAIIVGAGPLVRVHKKLVKKLGLSKVHLFGFVPDLKPIMKGADLYVFSSVEEGSSALSILEAMKEGLPIVCTNVDGMPEDIQNNKSALLVPSKNPLALANAMEKLLKSKLLAKKLGREAKKNYQKRYNLPHVKSAVRDFLIAAHNTK